MTAARTSPPFIPSCQTALQSIAHKEASITGMPYAGHVAELACVSTLKLAHEPTGIGCLAHTPTNRCSDGFRALGGGAVVAAGRSRRGQRRAAWAAGAGRGQGSQTLACCWRRRSGAP